MTSVPPTAEPPGRMLGPVAAPSLVFFCSGAVLVLEILSLRLVAPYVGLTLEVSTAVIGFALAAIAVGAWLGGLAADQVSPERMLGPLIVAAGALTLLVSPAVRWVGEGITEADDSAVLLMAAVSVFAPAALLSAVSPMVVKTQLGSLTRTGSVVGGLSGAGTAGALVGTFVTGFLLVAAAPTSRILLALGLVLIGLGIVLTGRARIRTAAAGGTTAALVGAGAFLIAPQPCDVETAYHCASVVPDEDRPSGRVLRLDTLRHSYVDLADPTYLEFAYMRAFGSVVDTMRPDGEPIDALHVGGGGATLPRYVDATRPGSDNLVLEIDQGVVDLDRRELGLVTGEGIEVDVVDGRVGIAEAGSDSHDLVVMDAFGGVAVPWHLTTRELVEDVERVLTPAGVYLVNVIDYRPFEFARAEVATITAVFDHVAVLARPSTFDGFGGGNIVIVASDMALPLTALHDAAADAVPEYAMVAGAQAAAFTRGADELSDDHAPVDQLVTTWSD